MRIIFDNKLQQIHVDNIIGKIFPVTQEFIDYYNKNCNMGECPYFIGGSFEILKYNPNEPKRGCGIYDDGTFHSYILMLMGLELVEDG